MVIFVLFMTAAAPEFEADLDFIARSNPLVRTASEPAAASDFTIRQASELRLMLTALIRLYQVFVSPQGPPGCNFTVTCSHFMTQSVKEYGLVHGLLMESDRLTRCNGGGRAYYPWDREQNRAVDHPVRAYYLFNRDRIIRR